MASVMSEKTKRKLHYKALVIGILKAVKNSIEDQQIKEVLDECIDIADKLGDGYKLCKVDDVTSELYRRAETCKYAIEADTYLKIISLIKEACDEG